MNRFLIFFIIFCLFEQAYSQSYLKLIDTKKSKTYTILPGTVLAFTSSKCIGKIDQYKIKKNKKWERNFRGTFRYMEDSNMVFTLNDAGSNSFGAGPTSLTKNDTTLYKFNINEIKRIRIVFVGDETFWRTYILFFSIIGFTPPIVKYIANTNNSFGTSLLMAAGAGLAIGFVDGIIEDLIYPQKPRKVIGKRYKFEIHPIEKSKFYVQPN